MTPDHAIALSEIMGLIDHYRNQIPVSAVTEVPAGQPTETELVLPSEAGSQQAPEPMPESKAESTDENPPATAPVDKSVEPSAAPTDGPTAEPSAESIKQNDGTVVEPSTAR